MKHQDKTELMHLTERARNTKTKTILATPSLALSAAIALPAGAQEVLPRPEQPFGGNGTVVFFGLAKPVRTPLIGPPRQP